MNELARALIGNSAAAPASNILEAIPDALAHAKPTPAVPHSIYEEVWHLAYWQDLTLDWIQGRPTPRPENSTQSFPSESSAASEPWPALQRRFLTGAESAAAIANDTASLDTVVICPADPAQPRPENMTVREQLESLAGHNAYHLGRVVLLRQLLGIWPPPSGGYK